MLTLREERKGWDELEGDGEESDSLLDSDEDQESGLGSDDSGKKELRLKSKWWLKS